MDINVDILAATCIVRGMCTDTAGLQFNVSFICLPALYDIVILGFGHEVDEIWALLLCYAAYSGNSLQTFRENLSVPSSRDSWPLKIKPISCSETLVMSHHYTPRNITEERRPPYTASMIMNNVHIRSTGGQGKPKYSEKNPPTVTINVTRISLSLKPGLRGWR